MAETSEPALVALDWGTTSLRAWLLDGRGRVLDSARAPRGVMQVAGGDFAGALGDVTAAWPSLPAIAAGMVGSAQGWVEAPYLPCPASPGDLAGALVQAPGRELWTVWNSHLRYRTALDRIVGPTVQVARNAKFTVTRSVRR